MLQTAYGVSQRRVCRLLRFGRSSCRFQSVADEQAALRIRLRDLAGSRVGYGYRRLYVLLQRESWRVNHKRVHRLCCLEGLQMRPKKQRRHATACRRMEGLAAAGPNDGWCMDFMHDELFDGRRIRLLTMDPVASLVPENGTTFDVRQAASYAIVEGENGTPAQRLVAESSAVRHI